MLTGGDPFYIFREEIALPTDVEAWSWTAPFECMIIDVHQYTRDGHIGVIVIYLRVEA